MSRNEHRYSKYKKCLSMVKLKCIKQRLSNTEVQLIKLRLS